MNKENIKYYADLILNKSIEITSYEADKQILFKYNHNKVINTVIRKNRYRFTHEYNDSTILRDEVYASYYESLLTLIRKQGYSEEDMDLIVNDMDAQEQDITKEFFKLLEGYTNMVIKRYLIDPTRRDKTNNRHIDTITIYDSELYDMIPQEEPEEEDIEDINKPQYNVLTRTDKEYLIGEKVYNNKNSEYKKRADINRRIKNMTERERESVLEQRETREDIISRTLNIENPNRFVMAVKKEQRLEWFMDLIVEYVPAQHRIDFNRNKITNKTVMAYRAALHKALDNNKGRK